MATPPKCARVENANNVLQILGKKFYFSCLFMRSEIWSRDYLSGSYWQLYLFIFLKKWTITTSLLFVAHLFKLAPCNSPRNSQICLHCRSWFAEIKQRCGNRKKLCGCTENTMSLRVFGSGNFFFFEVVSTVEERFSSPRWDAAMNLRKQLNILALNLNEWG